VRTQNSRRAALDPSGYLGLAKRLLGEIPGDEGFRKLGSEWNRVVDFAVLLEPVYWPHIVNARKSPSHLSEPDVWRAYETFRTEALEFTKTLDPMLWKRVHECLLIDAARLDQNSSLHILLRAAKWERRQNLKGTLSGALWLRHMAEVIRRAFEDSFQQDWPEEYEGAGHWGLRSKERIFSAERPLEDVMRTKPFVTSYFGLFTGSSFKVVCGRRH
jgi:hypothetical protein